jgi:hypothetical protein
MTAMDSHPSTKNATRIFWTTGRGQCERYFTLPHHSSICLSGPTIGNGYSDVESGATIGSDIKLARLLRCKLQ